MGSMVLGAIEGKDYWATMASPVWGAVVGENGAVGVSDGSVLGEDEGGSAVDDGEWGELDDVDGDLVVVTVK